ncbi:hypothetical protein BH10PAT1_BH10PAT1_7700 [soil metagenome]
MIFNKAGLQKLYKPESNSSGEDNGQVTIIGGSSLFHGAPLYGLKVASRIVDMVFFASPEKSVGSIAENLKSKLFSFIWTPWNELEKYIEKSDAILIGPGFLRYTSENSTKEEREKCDDACQLTKSITENLLAKFPNKKWVIDAGSLQTMDPKFIPKNSILTPNKKEFKILFNLDYSETNAKKMSFKYNCIIVVKGPVTFIFNKDEIIEVHGGNAGMTKGGTGDTQAGLTVALLAKNNAVLAACAGAYIIKAAADELYKTKGIYYNSDDLSEIIPSILFSAVTAVK